MRSPDTVVVVNCGGRTRSIIGAQALINSGVENRVYALKDGTQGWHLAGYTLDHGRTDEAPLPSAAGAERSREAAARVIRELLDEPGIDDERRRRHEERVAVPAGSPLVNEH